MCSIGREFVAIVIGMKKLIMLAFNVICIDYKDLEFIRNLALENFIKPGIYLIAGICLGAGGFPVEGYKTFTASSLFGGLKFT